MNKLSKAKQLEFIANDVAILETLFANKEDHWVVLPGQYMPDGEEFKVSLEGIKEMTGELRKKLVDTVKDQYDAREAEQNAPKASAAPPHERDSGGADTASSDSRGGSGTIQSSIPGVEKTLLETLEARKEDLLERLEYLHHQLTVAKDDYDANFKEYQRIEVCINALQKELPEELPTTEQETASPKQRDGSKKGSASSQKKTTNRSNQNSAA